jgi:hypothetical protein
MKIPHDSEETYKSCLKSTYFEVCEALQDGRFAQWPKETQKASITILSEIGAAAQYSTLHFAAREGLLNQISPEILTEDSLLIPNSYGWSGMQLAAHLGHLHQIPFTISEKTLRNLLENPETSRESKKWIQKELHKADLQRSIKNSNHPDL